MKKFLIKISPFVVYLLLFPATLILMFYSNSFILVGGILVLFTIIKILFITTFFWITIPIISQVFFKKYFSSFQLILLLLGIYFTVFIVSAL